MGLPQQSHSDESLGHVAVDDAEKGMYDSTTELTAPLPFAYLSQEKVYHIEHVESPLSGTVSPVHQGITPMSSVPQLSLAFPKTERATDANKLNAIVKKPEPVKSKVSRWILFDLWFNTYRKLFTLVTLLNLTGIIMAALGRFAYAENHLGALVLGNLLFAILMRNELFIRFLYLLAIYGLKSVSRFSSPFSTIANSSSKWAPVRFKIAATSFLQHVGGIHSGCALSGAGYLSRRHVIC